MARFVDARCGCSRCVARTENVYRMMGHCVNCGANNILILYREGDEAARQDCPMCGNWRSVTPDRLATADEIPADSEQKGGGDGG